MGIRPRRFTPSLHVAVALFALIGLLALAVAGSVLLGTSVNESAPPIAFAETPQILANATSAAPTTQSIATLPTMTPPPETAVPLETVPRAGYAAASRPSLNAQQSITSLPTVTPGLEPESVRIGCDPAYPDERTCIPPGLPLDQPCAITDERNFTVLPPDPRGLDADGDGVGCEPLSP
jgi:hypothetical protein